MEQRTGAQRRRAPVRVARPAWDWFRGMLLLCLTFGTLLAACHDAWLAGDHGWASFFAFATAITVVLYLYVVHLWVNCLFE